MLSPSELEALNDELETLTRILEEDCDYPIEEVLRGGSCMSGTAIRGQIDVVLLLKMKAYSAAMVSA